jgi:hypothetical protein
MESRALLRGVGDIRPRAHTHKTRLREFMRRIRIRVPHAGRAGNTTTRGRRRIRAALG